MGVLIKRNVKLYFRDKVNMFFSLLSVLLIIVLFALFLGTGFAHGNAMIDSWLMAGVIAVAAVTTSLGALSVIVDDRQTKRNKGFYASPIRRSSIAAGYILGAFVVSVIMTAITAIGLTIYGLIRGGSLLSAPAYLQMAGIILLASISGTAMVCFIVSLIKTNSAYGTISTIIGTLIGFLAGIYFPMGQAPEFLRPVMVAFPPSQAAMLLRRITMADPIAYAFYAEPEYIQGFQDFMGYNLTLGNLEITAPISIAYLLITAAIFYGLSYLNMRKMVK